MPPKWTRTSVAALALLLAACGHADPQCDAVQTSIVTTFAQGCASPVGVCTTGNIPSGGLAGTTQFSALTITQGATPDVMVYTGDLVITTATGTVTLRDSGLLNSSTGYYIEMQQVISGTGAYAQHSGMLMSQGLATGTGFQGELSGSLCQLQ